MNAVEPVLPSERAGEVSEDGRDTIAEVEPPDERDEPPLDEPPLDEPPLDEPVDEPPVDQPPDDDYVPPDLDTCANGPLEAPIQNCAPAMPPSTGDWHQDCVNRINQLRWECQCLGPLQRWTGGEDCADQMAESDHNSGQAHGATNQGLCEWGFAQNECPGWGDAQQCVEGCLQMMWDEGPGPFWAGHGHYINMTSSDYQHVACGIFVGDNGAWSVQNFY